MYDKRNKMENIYLMLFRAGSLQAWVGCVAILQDDQLFLLYRYVEPTSD